MRFYFNTNFWLSVITGFIVALSIFVGRPKSPRPPTPPPLASPEMTPLKLPKVTSSACHVVGNKTTCFRFASNLTKSRCSAVEGVIINDSSSSSSSSPSLLSSASAATTVICYHNICLDFIVDNRFCFINRSYSIFSCAFAIRPKLCMWYDIHYITFDWLNAVYRTRNRKQLGRKWSGKEIIKFWGGFDKQSALELRWRRAADCSSMFQIPLCSRRVVRGFNFFNQPNTSQSKTLDQQTNSQFITQSNSVQPTINLRTQGRQF